MSATRMLVLGTIRLAGQAHGYQVRSQLLGLQAQDWARINPGSIYHAIHKAVADGLLVEVAAEPGDGGPGRVAYRITEEGVAALRSLVVEGLRHLRDPWMLNAALAMLPHVRREDALAALDRRLDDLDRTEEEMLPYEGGTFPGSPEHVAEQVRLWLSQVRTNREWASGLRDRLAAGHYRFDGDR